MSEVPTSKKVIIHLGEDGTYRGKSAFRIIFEYLVRKRIGAVYVARGVAGFGADHRMHTINIERLAEDLPIQIEFVTSLQKVDELMPELYEMAGTGLIEVQDTVLSSGLNSSQEKNSDVRKKGGRAQILRVFLGESDQWNGMPLFEALIQGMRANNIAGVTVYRGLMGFGQDQSSEDVSMPMMNENPITVVAIDEERKIQAFMPLLECMLSQGLVVLSEVETVRYTHDFRVAERRSEVR